MKLHHLVVSGMTLFALTAKDGSAQAPPVVTCGADCVAAAVDPFDRTERKGALVESGAGFCREKYKENAAATPDFISQGCFGFFPGRFVQHDTATIRASFGGFRTAGLATFGYSLEARSIGLYSEVVSDNFFVSASTGYARFSIGVLASGEGDASQGATTTEQFFQAGGNATVWLALPFFYYVNWVLPPSEDESRPVRGVDSYLVAGAGFDIPKLGANAEVNGGNVQLGLQNTAEVLSLTETIQVIVQADGSIVYGSEGLISNLGVPTEGSEWFLAGRALLGIEVHNSLRLGVDWAGATVGGITSPWRLSVELLPR